MLFNLLKYDIKHKEISRSTLEMTMRGILILQNLRTPYLIATPQSSTSFRR